MDSNSTSHRPPHLNLDVETHRLWDVFLKAKDDVKKISLMSAYLDCLSGCFDGHERQLVMPASVGLLLLIHRAKALANEAEKSLQEIAWQFATHAFRLRRGDLVERGERTLSADHLFAVDKTVGNLGLRGRILTKSGIPGKQELEFSLLHKTWSKVAPGTTSDPPQA
jgi:hypothetical protein